MCCDLLVGLLFGWWIGREIDQTRRWQEQMLERLPYRPEEEPEITDVELEPENAEARWINRFTHTFRDRMGRAPTDQESWLAQWTFRLYQAEEEITRERLLTAWPWQRRGIWRVWRALRAAGYDPVQSEEGAYEVDAEH